MAPDELTEIFERYGIAHQWQRDIIVAALQARERGNHFTILRSRQAGWHTFHQALEAILAEHVDFSKEEAHTPDMTELCAQCSAPAPEDMVRGVDFFEDYLCTNCIRLTFGV